MMSAHDDLAAVICICTGNHNPRMRVECAYAERAAAAVIRGWLPSVRADAVRRLELLRMVVAYDTANQSDLPLGLLDALRAEVKDG